MHKKRVTVVAGAAKGIGHEVAELPHYMASKMGVTGFTRVVGRGSTLTADRSRRIKLKIALAASLRIRRGMRR